MTSQHRVLPVKPKLPDEVKEIATMLHKLTIQSSYQVIEQRAQLESKPSTTFTIAKERELFFQKTQKKHDYREFFLILMKPQYGTAITRDLIDFHKALQSAEEISKDKELKSTEEISKDISLFEIISKTATLLPKSAKEVTADLNTKLGAYTIQLFEILIDLNSRDTLVNLKNLKASIEKEPFFSSSKEENTAERSQSLGRPGGV